MKYIIVLLLPEVSQNRYVIIWPWEWPKLVGHMTRELLSRPKYTQGFHKASVILGVLQSPRKYWGFVKILLCKVLVLQHALQRPFRSGFTSTSALRDYVKSMETLWIPSTLSGFTKPLGALYTHTSTHFILLQLQQLLHKATGAYQTDSVLKGIIGLKLTKNGWSHDQGVLSSKQSDFTIPQCLEGLHTHIWIFSFFCQHNQGLHVYKVKQPNP